jgi:hypothetical protein
MHHGPRLVGTLCCALSLAVLLPAASTASGVPTYSTPTAAQTATLTPDELTLLNSGQPISVLMDPTTGDILSVTAAGDAQPNISHHSVCNTGDGCYKTNDPPYADIGFYGGSGTVNGDWPERSAYWSGKWTVSACWAIQCGPKIGPGSQVTFTSDVTGTSFTIY